MPNFIAKNIKEIKYPLQSGDIKFLWQVQGRNEKLVFTQNKDDSFFITLKSKNDGNFVIKGDKLSKPSRIANLQKALYVFKELLCENIVSEAISKSDKNVAKSDKNVAQIDKILSLMPKFNKIFIEIGFGSGRHLLFQAQNNKDCLIIGIEVYKPSIEQVSKLATSKNLDNIRLINTDARLLLSLMPSNLIDKIFLHFPVPWDDSPHRRVVSLDFAKECQRVLKVGGTFELRSDSKMYTDFTSATFLELENAKISIQKNISLEISSKYEDRWKRQEKDIFDLFYTCEQKSSDLEELEPMCFNESYDMSKMALNFKNTTIKGDDFFVHFEELYQSEDKIIIRVAFGSFSKPEHTFIKFENNTCEYFIKMPILTKTNLKAHRKIKEHLSQCNR
ncbi:tRNA (guanosine(46)-N7)-methyltransferase TrmB [Campylobacter mucosalis]|uniref:tRNA (guanosine(46)-N7)-methyltransferase TrmB n=1 Tax=Campylobacter mucosalis TaxID=202 RepID=UPI00147078D3|nr:tRNA (guanosine(46)-N7)-methyltransferase TrmB [Campylobacter mucosalis]